MADQTLPLDVSYEMNKNETGQEKEDMSVEENLYSSSLDTPEELCSSSVTDTCRDGCIDVKERHIRGSKALEIRHCSAFGSFEIDRCQKIFRVLQQKRFLICV